MTDHVCMCYGCSAHKLPPRDEKNKDIREFLLDGHYRSNSCYPLKSVTIDGVTFERRGNLIAPGVQEFQLGREPWALIISDPATHPCKCNSHQTCRSLIFPKSITYEVADYAREHYEAAKARNTSWTIPGECEDCHTDSISYHGKHPSLCLACAQKRDEQGIPW